jgi:hypothetical protein
LGNIGALEHLGLMMRRGLAVTHTRGGGLLRSSRALRRHPAPAAPGRQELHLPATGHILVRLLAAADDPAGHVALAPAAAPLAVTCPPSQGWPPVGAGQCEMSGQCPLRSFGTGSPGTRQPRRVPAAQDNGPLGATRVPSPTPPPKCEGDAARTNEPEISYHFALFLGLVPRGFGR